MSEANLTSPNWVKNSTLLWERRRLLLRVGIVALAVSTVIAFTIPKQYESTASIMPPDQPSSGSAMLAALAGRSLPGPSGLGSLAGSLLGGHTSSALYMDLLHSRTIDDHLIDRFNLMHVYHKRYRIDTVKYLTRHTKVAEDKKSGVLTLTFTDTDAERAHAITQAYLDELNTTVTHSNVSSARREREFIERRLVSVKEELQTAQKALSEFSSVNTTLDIKEQTHAIVDAAARLQAEVIIGESELGGLQQIYGEDNVRVRAARARIASLHGELKKMSGSSVDMTAEPAAATNTDSPNLYPSLRQLPRLAVPYANLYRTVRIQETVFELLSQQYEMARIEEAKDTPVVSVIDAPLVAEKKSFPPRLLVMLALTALALLGASILILLSHSWQQVDSLDPRKVLAEEIVGDLRTKLQRFTTSRGSHR
jgi:capsule polysaccharide export protein KpsE/RkpR